jgi:hypothetical protein
MGFIDRLGHGTDVEGYKTRYENNAVIDTMYGDKNELRN